MRILTDCSILSEQQIKRIEDQYSAKYVFETQLKLRSDEWSSFSAAVFYTEEPHPEGSHWLGIWSKDGKFMISNAISAVEEPFFGVVAESGDIIYSRHPRDFRESEDKTVFVDGGRDHFRHDLEHKIVQLKVVKDKIVVLSRDNKRAVCDVPFTEELSLDMNLS